MVMNVVGHSSPLYPVYPYIIYLEHSGQTLWMLSVDFGVLSLSLSVSQKLSDDLF